MKKIAALFIMALGFTLSTQAQTKAVQKVVISTPTVQCSMCKSKIETSLFKQNGINAVKVDYKKKTTTVTYVTDRTSPERLRAMIANLGYDADDYIAEESAYKRLPACCKKPADEKKAQ